MLSQQEYKEYCSKFRSVESYLRKYSAPLDVVAYNVCKLRGYYTERMSGILQKAGFMFIEDNSVYSALSGVGNDIGLFKNGEFLLQNRFIFPVRDMLGNTIAFIGWFPDDKKYITTPSKLFSKSCLFYGMEQLLDTGLGGKYFIVEGIFDTLSLRSIGVNALGMMGITSGRVKEGLYCLMSNIAACPDNDAQGKDVVENDKWHLPTYGRYFKWIGDDSKDIDELVNSYEATDIKEFLMKAFLSKERVVKQRV